jgi:hypothetical protein
MIEDHAAAHSQVQAGFGGSDRDGRGPPGGVLRPACLRAFARIIGRCVRGQRRPAEGWREDRVCTEDRRESHVSAA